MKIGIVGLGLIGGSLGLKLQSLNNTIYDLWIGFLEALSLGFKHQLDILRENNLPINNRWPLIADIEENFYFKDQNNQIFASPADEKPSYPHDCFPDDLDVAIGIDRIQKATIFQFNNIEYKWSGLRTFVSDKSPVVGFENDKKNFFHKIINNQT